MKGLKFLYRGGAFARAARVRRPPKGVPPADTILFQLRKPKGGGGVTIYLRPDEAVAIAATLCAAVWDDSVRNLA